MITCGGGRHVWRGNCLTDSEDSGRIPTGRFRGLLLILMRYGTHMEPRRPDEITKGQLASA